MVTDMRSMFDGWHIITKINQELNVENNDFVFMSRYKKGGVSEDDTMS